MLRAFTPTLPPPRVPCGRRRMLASKGTGVDLKLEMRVILWLLQAKLESEASILPRTWSRISTGPRSSTPTYWALPRRLEFQPIGVEWTFPTGETFGIVKPPNAPWEKGGGVHFGVDDINATVAACKANGISFEDDAKIYETPGCFLAFAFDSEGNDFIFHQLKPR